VVLSAMAGAALAGTVALTGGGGWDILTAQPWAGVDLALHPSNDRGFAGIGRVQGAWGFADGAPLPALEVGGVVVVPHPEAVIRVGLTAKMTGLYVPYPAPIRLGAPGTSADPGLGLLPSGMALVEFEWGDTQTFTLRAAGGTGSQAGAIACDDADVLDACVAWRGGFTGGISARARLRQGWFGELWAGPSASLTLGYAFPVRRAE